MRYPHAPITEAVLDVRVEPRPGIQVSELQAIKATIGSEFPEEREQTRILASMSFGVDATAHGTTRTVSGYQYVRPTSDKVLSVQIDGWTFSKLAPYDCWESFCAEGRKLWELYKLVAQPSRNVRLGVRYINRIDLPLPFDDYRQFLKTSPELSSDLPQGLSSFFMQLQIPLAKIEGHLTLNMTPVPSGREGFHSVILDLDIFKIHDVPQSEEELWKQFELLRHEKNAAFEACITDRTRELFK